jgi:hypothetical protein
MGRGGEILGRSIADRIEESVDVPEVPKGTWADPEKVDELKVEFCPIIRSRTNEEKSIQ